MGIKSRGNKYQIWPKIVQSWQYSTIKRFAEFPTARMWRERRVNNIAHSRFILCAGAWIKRQLMGRAEKHALIPFKNLLRPVTVMHIPIDNGNAFYPI